MVTQSDTAVDRRRRQIAATYRKQGYNVTVPATSGAVPAFLRDCHPDLIAEKDGDRVVIEVKRSRALKGANDLIELAERVAATPGWRLELVALRSDDEARRVLTPDWLKTMLKPPAPGTDIAHHCVYLTEVLAYLVRGIALINRIRVREKAAPRLAAELAFAGVIDQDLLDRIENAFVWRDALMHARPLSRTKSDQAAEIEEICHELEAVSHGAEV